MSKNYILLEKVTVGASGASSITFDNIPQIGYTDLVIRGSGRNSSSSTQLLITVNGSTQDYSGIRIFGSGSAVGATISNTANFNTTGVSNTAFTTNTFSDVEIYIPEYTSSNYKTFSVDGVSENNATEAYIGFNTGLWSNTAAINSVTLVANGGNFTEHSAFYLYGVSKLGTTPSIAPKAKGGNIVATDGTYWYHAFLTSGFFAPEINLSGDVLVIAGGGAGGYLYSGGGGAGGVCYQSGRLITAGNKTVTIGSGGVAPSSTANGGSGNNSVFDTITAIGGAGGAAWINGVGTNGFSGGSGSGGSMGSNAGNTTLGGAATQGNSGGATGYGNAGGGGRRGSGELYLAGGGGGAGQVGGTATSTQAGAGGNGLNTWSSWASATKTGVSGFYAGGGAGGAEGSGVVGQLGGSGGGGRGQLYNTITATSGVPNTGSGGGGIANQTTPGSGGSGIVIIRYPIS